MHPEAAAGAQTMLDARLNILDSVMPGPPLHCLDIGGQAVNGDVRSMFDQWSPVWDVLDVVPGPGVTIVGDATDPTLWGRVHNHYDVVLCTEVLEHVQDWPSIIQCAAMALRPTGTLILTCASSNRPPHGANGEPTPDGQWYANVEPDPLAAVLRAFFVSADVQYQYPPGDAYAWAYSPR